MIIIIYNKRVCKNIYNYISRKEVYNLQKFENITKLNILSVIIKTDFM